MGVREDQEVVCVQECALLVRVGEHTHLRTDKQHANKSTSHNTHESGLHERHGLQQQSCIESIAEINDSVVQHEPPAQQQALSAACAAVFRALLLLRLRPPAAMRLLEAVIEGVWVGSVVVPSAAAIAVIVVLKAAVAAGRVARGRCCGADRTAAARTARTAARHTAHERGQSAVHEADVAHTETALAQWALVGEQLALVELSLSLSAASQSLVGWRTRRRAAPAAAAAY